MQRLQQATRLNDMKTILQSVTLGLSGSLLLRTVNWAAIATLATVQALSLPVQAAILETWKFDPKTGQVEIQLPEGVTPRLVVLSDPGRLVLDLPETEVGINVTELYETGLVRQVSLTQFEEKTARITIEFAPGVVLDRQEVELKAVGVENAWIVRPAIVAVPEPTPELPLTPSEAPQTASAPAVTPPQTPAKNDDQPVVGSAADLEGATAQEKTTAPPPATALPAFTLPRSIQPVLPNPQPERAADVEIVSVGLGRSGKVEFIADPLLEGESFESREQVDAADVPAPSLSTGDEIRFGEPLPTAQANSQIATRPRSIEQRPPNIVLLKGTQLVLVYPNPNDVRLPTQLERQDVLLLQGGIVDRDGNYIAPPDTPVIGRFETGSAGSRFIAEAINLEGRSIPFKAESDWIDGTLEADTGNILLNSGIGGLGVFLLSGLSGIGLILGAIGGAAVGLVTSPQPTTLQPGQVIEVRLVEDLRQSEFIYKDPVSRDGLLPD
ncbi:MAG: AMIN domain-containing protein [Microcoleaceae cyanobacterium]